MAKPRLRLAAAAERLRESLWLIPGTMVVLAGAVASLLVRSRSPAPELPLQELLLPASASAATPVLQVVSASVITVTSVVFSLTVVALQITAGNYSPRALRTFLRDLGTQLVLGTFLATFAYGYVVLQNIQNLGAHSEAEWAPQTAFIVVPVFVLASVVALVFFIHHVTQAIRVDLILKEVLEENLDSIEVVHPEGRRHDANEHPRDLVPNNAAEVKSSATGFVQAFGLDDLLETLKKEDLIVAFRPSAGDHVLESAVLAWIWARDGSDVHLSREIAEIVRDAVQIGRERSMNNDVAYGIRQIVDIAVRALSPGVNDPNTAVSAILHLTVTYRELLTRQLGPQIVHDDDRVRRLIVPYPSLAEYLTITVQQVGHYGRADIMVVLRLLRSLAELRSLAAKEDYAALDQSIDALLQEAERGIDVEANLELARKAAHDAKEQTSRFRHYTAAG